MTIGDVITKARYLLSDADTPYRWGDGELLKHAFEAERRVVTMLPAEAYPALWVSTKRILVSGVKTYAYPNDMHRLAAMRVYSTQDLSAGVGVNIMPQEHENLQYDSDSYAPSSTFPIAVFKDGSMEIRPTPTTTIANGVEFNYMQRIADGSSTDTLVVSDSVGDAMAWYTGALALQYEEPDRSNAYRMQFNQMIAEESQRYREAATAARLRRP